MLVVSFFLRPAYIPKGYELEEEHLGKVLAVDIQYRKGEFGFFTILSTLKGVAD